MKKTQEQRGMELLAALACACSELPYGWGISLYMQRDGSAICLTDENEDEFEYPSNHESVADSIFDATAFAKQIDHNNQEQSWQTTSALSAD